MPVCRSNAACRRNKTGARLRRADPRSAALMLNMEQRARCSIVRMRRWSVSVRGRSLSAPPAAIAISSPKARLPAPAGACRERLHPYGRLPQPGRHHAQRGGYNRHVATVEYSSRSAGVVLLRHRLARLRDLYVRPRDGLENVSVYDGGWYEWSSDPKTRCRLACAVRIAASNRVIPDAEAASASGSRCKYGWRWSASRVRRTATPAGRNARETGSTARTAGWFHSVNPRDSKTIYERSPGWLSDVCRQRGKGEKTAAGSDKRKAASLRPRRFAPDRR